METEFADDVDDALEQFEEKESSGSTAMARRRIQEAMLGCHLDLATKEDRARFTKQLIDQYSTVSQGQLRREAETLGVLARGAGATRSGMARMIADQHIAEVRPKEAERKREKAKVNAAKPPRGPRPTYPAEIKAAAKRAAELLGPGFVPGPKQHLAVRAVVADRDPAKLVGMTRLSLEKYAKDGSIAKPARARLKGLADQVGDVGARNRNLAAILVVMIEEKAA